MRDFTQKHNAGPKTHKHRFHVKAQPRARKSHMYSESMVADSEVAPVMRAAGERGRRTITELGERLHRLRLISEIPCVSKSYVVYLVYLR